jgi:Haem-binding domain
MKKKLKWIFGALAAAFALLQSTNPARTNPPVKNIFPVTNAPPQVAAMLRAACYDCHSHETRWPWYSRVAPLSWQIADDVNEGRKNLNLSDWPNDDPKRAAKKFEDMSEQIGYGEMPLKKYTLIHADARLTDGQRKELTDWLDAEAARLKSPATAK